LDRQPRGGREAPGPGRAVPGAGPGQGVSGRGGCGGTRMTAAVGTALGLGLASGLSLYGAAFLTGLAIHPGWVRLDPALAALGLGGAAWLAWTLGRRAARALRTRRGRSTPTVGAGTGPMAR